MADEGASRNHNNNNNNKHPSAKFQFQMGEDAPLIASGQQDQKNRGCAEKLKYVN